MRTCVCARAWVRKHAHRSECMRTSVNACVFELHIGSNAGLPLVYTGLKDA